MGAHPPMVPYFSSTSNDWFEAPHNIFTPQFPYPSWDNGSHKSQDWCGTVRLISHTSFSYIPAGSSPYILILGPKSDFQVQKERAQD